MKQAILLKNHDNRPAFARPDMATKMKKLDRFLEQMLIVGVIAASMVMMLFFVSLA